MAGKRSIFEEVGSAPQPALSRGAIGAGQGRRGAVLWLASLFALVVAMVLTGGLTRLTDSGLSITEWRPVTGMIPPMDAAAWQAEFARYRASPEFQLQNSAMDLAGFKAIYWWEWGHRALGRLIGLVWAAGFAGLWALRRLPPGRVRPLLAIGALIGIQGAVGWWMVTSGLKGGVVDVASYRLAVHLGLAFAILGLILNELLQALRDDAALIVARRSGEPRLTRLSTGLMHAAFLQILLGALVAGIDAGRAFPTWPLMGESFFPADAFHVPDGTAWRAFFENPGLVQFLHRMLGYLVTVFAIVVWLRARRSPHLATRRAFAVILALLLVQVLIGIFTVLQSAPLGLSLAHQGGAIALWSAILAARHLAHAPIVTSIRGST